MEQKSRTSTTSNRNDARTRAKAGSSSSAGNIRLNKAIADSGLASRRAADRLIEEGSVTVNGKRVFELGIKVDLAKDKILVAGKPLKAKSQAVYAVLHKPKGVLTTMDDPEGRPTIAGFIQHLPVRLFPVGRLDWDSEGLLLLTNDGDWAQKVMHPRLEVTKTYLVKVSTQPKPEALQKLRNGVSIVGGKVAAKFVGRVERGKEEHPWLKIVITEGKNRQIRLMFEKVGLDVLKLQRIAIGKLRLGSLPRGQMAFLNEVAANMVFQQDLEGTEESRALVKKKRAQQKSSKRLGAEDPDKPRKTSKVDRFKATAKAKAAKSKTGPKTKADFRTARPKALTF